MGVHDGYYDEDLDEYEDEEGGEQEYEEGEEYEEEKPQEPTREEKEYLALRQRLKESIRKKIKKESGSSLNNGHDRRSKLPYDNFGSFFGPSQPVIAPRVIEESKSLLETQHLAAMNQKKIHGNKKSFASTSAGHQRVAQECKPRVNELKSKADQIRATRDYSFLLSDDAEPSAPTKEYQPQNTARPKSDLRAAQVSIKGKQSLGNSSRQLHSGHQEMKSVPAKYSKQLKMGLQNSHANKSNPNSASCSKPNMVSVESRKQLGSNNGNGPGRPVGPKGIPIKTPTATNVRPPIVGKKNSISTNQQKISTVNKSMPSKLPTSMPKQYLPQRKEYGESKMGKVVPKQPVMSSRPMVSKPSKQMLSRPSSHEHHHKKKAGRPHFESDDEDDEARDALSMLRQMLGPKRRHYSDDEDDRAMEANFDDIQMEERRSAKIARMEDEEELRKIEEEERRVRMRKLEKKRKLQQR